MASSKAVIACFELFNDDNTLIHSFSSLVSRPLRTALLVDSSLCRAGLFKKGSLDPPKELSIISLSTFTNTLWHKLLASNEPFNTELDCKASGLADASVVKVRT